MMLDERFARSRTPNSKSSFEAKTRKNVVAHLSARMGTRNLQGVGFDACDGRPLAWRIGMAAILLLG